MIGLVIVTHGRLAHALLAAAEHVVGPQPHVRALSVEPDDDLEERRADIRAAVQEVDAGRGVVIATDMFGGTPANLAVSQMRQGQVEVLAGANVPMLIRLIETRGEASLAEAVDRALEAGRRYIALARAILDGEPS